MLGFRLARSPANLQFTFPYWFAVFAAIILGALAARPWIRFSKRFSLRTLLLAMTLVAIECALVVWLR